MPDSVLPVFMGLQPSARAAFGQSTIEFLSAFFRQKLIVNNFMHRNDTTVALDAGVVGPPAQAAFPLKLSPLALIGSTTYSIVLEARATDPYRGILAARFIGSTANGQGAQWSQGNVGDLVATSNLEFIDPIDALWCSELVMPTIITQGGTFIGLFQPGVALLNSSGQITSSLANCIGFHFAPGGDINAVTGDAGGINIYTRKIGTFVQNRPVQLAIRYHFAGRVNDTFHPDSFIEWYLNGVLIHRLSTPFDGWAPGGGVPSGLTPGVAVIRATGPFNPIIPYWAYGYGVKDAVFG